MGEAPKTRKSRGKRGTGWLYKRDSKGREVSADYKSNGPFYIGYYPVPNKPPKKHVLKDSNGRSITNRKEAEAKRLEIIAPLLAKQTETRLENVKAQLEAAHQKTSALEHDSKPALKLADAWIAYKKSHNRPKSGISTLKRYESTINAFTKWMKEHYPNAKEMRQVDVEHAEAYADHLEGKNLSPSSFNIYLNNLSGIWATLFDKALLTKNPFAWDKKSRSGIQRKNVHAESTLRKKRALTLDEVNAVIEKATGDYRTLLIILICTGQRLVDGLKLRWSEIDFEKNLITLTPRKTATRTGKQVHIPIFPQLRGELESLSHESKYVLPELVKAYDHDKSIITKAVRKIFDAAGLTAHKETSFKTGKAIVETGTHSLRHSYVTLARLEGFPDPLIMKVTGHNSQEMVEYYTDFDEKLVARLAANMPHAIKGQNQLFINAPSKQHQLPDWAVEKLKTANKDNWEAVIKEVLKDVSEK